MCCAPGHDDLTVLTGAPGPAGNPFPYVSAPFGVQNVVYRSGDGHLHVLYWSTGAVGPDDLTVVSGAAPAAGDPVTCALREAGEGTPTPARAWWALGAAAALALLRRRRR